MDSADARIGARDLALGRLNEITTWVAVGAVAAVGVFAVTAAQTIPGKAASSQNPSSTSSTGVSASAGTSFFGRHHDDSGTISASSGPGIVVTGGSR